MGKWDEKQAAAFLRRHGFDIVDHNFYTTFRELDIVAVKGGDYYFVEVKTRFQKDLATDLAIAQFKKKYLLKAIKIYCYKNKIGEASLILCGLIVSADRLKKR